MKKGSKIIFENLEIAYDRFYNEQNLVNFSFNILKSAFYDSILDSYKKDEEKVQKVVVLQKYFKIYLQNKLLVELDGKSTLKPQEQTDIISKNQQEQVENIVKVQEITAVVNSDPFKEAEMRANMSIPH